MHQYTASSALRGKPSLLSTQFVFQTQNHSQYELSSLWHVMGGNATIPIRFVFFVVVFSLLFFFL